MNYSILPIQFCIYHVSVCFSIPYHVSATPRWSINSLGFETATMKLYALLAVAVALPIPRPARRMSSSLDKCEADWVTCARSDEHIDTCTEEYKVCERKPRAKRGNGGPVAFLYNPPPLPDGTLWESEEDRTDPDGRVRSLKQPNPGRGANPVRGA